MSRSLVVMGVAGCGKSTLAQAVAAELGLACVEGDDHHAPASRAKMSQGIPLTDADREVWLDTLGALLGARPDGVVLSCSALKRGYRERLRAACPGLRFVYLDLPFEEAHRRVASRAGTHFFAPELVADQYRTLEPPTGESGVLRLDATAPPAAQCAAVVAWWRRGADI